MTPSQPMPKQLEVNFMVQGMIREDRQTRSFVAYCPSLDLYSAGRTRPDAKKALACAVDTYVRLCFERGILGRVLKSKGFHTSTGASERPTTPGQFIAVTVTEHATEYDDVFDFQVPLHLIAAAQASSEAGTCRQ